MIDYTTSDLNIPTISARLVSIFDKARLKKLAIECGFIKRRTSRIEGYEIALALIEKGLIGDKCPLSICCDAIASINPHAQMTVQSLKERINSPGCALFFQSILEGCIHNHLSQNIANLISDLSLIGQTQLHRYSAVNAIDCTEIALNSALKGEFKGSGGGQKNSESSLKILASINVRDFIFSHLSISDRTAPDQVLGKMLASTFKTNEMYLLDKGFFSTELLDKIEEKGAYYIMPLHGSCKIFANETDSEPISLALHINKSFKKRGYFDKILFITKAKKPVRVLAYAVKEKSVQKKLKNYLKQCRKYRRPPSEEIMERFGLMILITNDFSVTPEVIACLYRLRWQIELVFKTWKSQMQIDHCQGTNPNRIRVLIYSHLIAATLFSFILAPILLVLELYHNKELSHCKSVNWISQGDRALKILKGDSYTINSLFQASLKWLCKEDSRRRKTTKQTLRNLSEANEYAA